MLLPPSSELYIHNTLQLNEWENRICLPVAGGDDKSSRAVIYVSSLFTHTDADSGAQLQLGSILVKCSTSEE